VTETKEKPGQQGWPGSGIGRWMRENAQLSRNERSLRERLGCLSLRSAFASI
jgi:hypothetical protein